MRPLMDEANIDRFGNAVGVRLCGKPGAPKLLLDAHLDEIGLLVTGIEEGFLRFRSIGGVDPRMLPDREVVVLSQPPVCGIVAAPPPEALAGDAAGKSIPISKLWIDVGLDQAAAEKAIPCGHAGGSFERTCSRWERRRSVASPWTIGPALPSSCARWSCSGTSPWMWISM